MAGSFPRRPSKHSPGSQGGLARTRQAWSIPPMTRTFALLMLATAGCANFASYARKSNGYPGSYDRTLRHADELGDTELSNLVKSLGASRDYNSATHDLLWCLDHYADAQRWQRQTESGDFITQEKLVAESKAAPDDYWLQESLRADLAHLKEPAQQWVNASRECVDGCSKVLAPNAYEKPNARDAELARTYLARCQSSVASAEQAQKHAGDRQALADASQRVQSSDALAAKGCFLRASMILEGADHDLAHVPDDDASRPVRASVGALRQKYAEGFGRVQRYQQKPRVIALQKQLKRVGHAEGMVGTSAKDAHEAAAASGYSADAVRLEAQAEQADRVRADLGEQYEEVNRELMDIARADGILCR